MTGSYDLNPAKILTYRKRDMESGEDIFEFPGERSKEKAAVDGGGEERGEPAEEFVNGELAIEAIVFHAQMDGGNKDLSDEAKKEFVVQAVVRMDSETMEVKSVFESVERFFDHILVPVNINSFLRVIQRIADKNHPATGGELFFDDVFADRDGIAIRSGRGFADNEVFLKVLSEFGMMGVQKSFLVEFCNKTEEVVSFLHLFLRIEIDKGVQLVAALPPTAYLMHAADNTSPVRIVFARQSIFFSSTSTCFWQKGCKRDGNQKMDGAVGMEETVDIFGAEEPFVHHDPQLLVRIERGHFR